MKNLHLSALVPSTRCISGAAKAAWEKGKSGKSAQEHTWTGKGGRATPSQLIFLNFTNFLVRSHIPCRCRAGAEGAGWASPRASSPGHVASRAYRSWRPLSSWISFRRHQDLRGNDLQKIVCPHLSTCDQFDVILIACPDAWLLFGLGRTVEELLTKTTLGALRETLAWPLRHCCDTADNRTLKHTKAAKLTCELQAVEKFTQEIHVWTLLFRAAKKKNQLHSLLVQKGKWKCALMSGLGHHPSRLVARHDLADPASKRETLRPWWCCSSHSGVVLLRCLARAEQQRRRERKQAELALNRFQKAAEKEAKERLWGMKRQEHMNPHVVRQAKQSLNSKRAIKKRDLREIQGMGVFENERFFTDSSNSCRCFFALSKKTPSFSSSLIVRHPNMIWATKSNPYSIPLSWLVNRDSYMQWLRRIPITKCSIIWVGPLPPVIVANVAL